MNEKLFGQNNVQKYFVHHQEYGLWSTKGLRVKNILQNDF